MAKEDKVGQAIYQTIVSLIAARATFIRTGVWLAAESVDSNLSQVNVAGATFRYIPKLKSVTVSAGETVMMIGGPDTPLIIIGVVQGDITKAVI